MDMTEEQKIKALKELVDKTCGQIENGDLSEPEAKELINKTRQEAEQLIPDDMDKFDMIYAARFERLVDQFIRTKQTESN